MDISNDTNEEQRRQYVAHMNEVMALANVFPNAEDLAIQVRYIAGTATLEDLLDPARAYAARAAQRKRQAAMDFVKASLYLSGLHPSDVDEKRTRQVVMGEISLEEFLLKRN